MATALSIELPANLTQKGLAFIDAFCESPVDFWQSFSVRADRVRGQIVVAGKVYAFTPFEARFIAMKAEACLRDHWGRSTAEVYMLPDLILLLRVLASRVECVEPTEQVEP